MKKLKCQTCGKSAHNYSKTEVLNCVPPLSTLKFGDYWIKRAYRNALYAEQPYYTAEDIIGSFLGENPYFPSQEEWVPNKK